MSKLTYIIIGAVWIIFLGIIFLGVSSSPSDDQLNGVKTVVKTIQNYLDNKPIETEGIKNTGPNGEFAIATAKFFHDLKQVESELNQQDAKIRLFVQKANLQSPEVLQINLLAIAPYIQLATDSFNKEEQIIQTYISELGKINQDDENLVFQIPNMKLSLEGGKAERESARNNRIGMASYIKTMLEFVQTRSASPGYMEFTTNGVNFNYPDDKQYYQQIYTGYYEYAKKVDEYKTKTEDTLRKSIAGANLPEE